MPILSSPAIGKHRPIKKGPKTCSQPRILANKLSLTQNFHAFLREVAYPQHSRPTNPLISFLNINKPQRQASLTSLHYIPSIENMMSQQNIEDEPIHTLSSIQHGFSEEIVSENNYELKVLYICLLQKIIKHLPYYPSASQRRKIIRGTWNILVKYVKDNNYLIFNRIGTQIQWGLLELINFNFNPSLKEKYHAECRLSLKKQSSLEESLTII